MSRETLTAIEDAIRAHIRDVDEDDDTKPVLKDWIIAFATEHIVTFEEGETPSLSTVNDYTASDGDPNAQIGLAHWLARKLEHDAQHVCDLHLHCDDEEPPE